MENLLDLIYEHYTENNPVGKNTVAGKAAKAKEKELEEWLRGLEGISSSGPNSKIAASVIPSFPVILSRRINPEVLSSFSSSIDFHGWFSIRALVIVLARSIRSCRRSEGLNIGKTRFTK